MLLGYMRVSKSDGSQSLDLQRDALLAAGVAPERLYEDHASGRQDARPGLVAYLSPADNVSRPFPYRLRRLHQPVMSSPNWFSTPRSTLLSSIGAHASAL